MFGVHIKNELNNNNKRQEISAGKTGITKAKILNKVLKTLMYLSVLRLFLG